MQRNRNKFQIFKNRETRYWMAECPCGWWHMHQSHQLLRDISQRHWAWSVKHAAARVSNRALDRFNVGKPA